jgi:hypothetical protein
VEALVTQPLRIRTSVQMHFRAKEQTVTKAISEMTKEELIWAIEGYAASARKSFDKGSDPWPTLSRVKAMIDHYKASR